MATGISIIITKIVSVLTLAKEMHKNDTIFAGV